ncbi:DMT family transporter [Enterovibrio norvegicus]|uniref:DMT family transporter n=1 Tax=Enterovibrio norvegicus TaxID=188144 RepID=UPI000C867FED|nr:DMT family transporter [Enterovibrio norvegicus]PML79972.1 hypothetical protein BCT69_02310 [Enterovibrio norvegicus]
MPSLVTIAFIALGVVWGTMFLFTKWAAEFITPVQIVFLRVVFGFLPLFFYALYKRVLRWEDVKHWKHFVVMSLIATSLYYIAFAEGTALLPSSIAGMLSGAIPLFTFVSAALLLRDEPITLGSMTGTAMGFLGVLLIAQPWQSDVSSVNGLGTLYMIAGAFSVGISFVYAKHFIKPLGLKPLALATYQTGFAMVFLLFVTDMSGITLVFEDAKASLGLVFGLGILGTGMAYIIYYYLVDQMGAIVASGVTYIPPVVALLIGAFLINEPISSVDLGAMAFIMVGVWFVQKARTQSVKEAS